MNDKEWRYRVMLMDDMGWRYSFKITMWKMILCNRLSGVTLSCDTGCQSCKRALNTAQIFQWHAIKYSISNRVRRWSSIEIYKITLMGLSRFEFLFRPKGKKCVVCTVKKQERKWPTRCCFVTFQISSSEINVTKSHYFITNYIFTRVFKKSEKRLM